MLIESDRHSPVPTLDRHIRSGFEKTGFEKNRFRKKPVTRPEKTVAENREKNYPVFERNWMKK
jgi:hypothetical protein